MSIRSGHRVWRLVVAGMLLLALSRCDLPTQAPSFEVEPAVHAPLFAEKTFVLLGASTDKVQAIIDTTRQGWDTLFQADAQGKVSLVWEQPLKGLGNLEKLKEEIASRAASPVRFSFALGDLASDRWSAQFEIPVGDLTLPPQDLGETGLRVGVLLLPPLSFSEEAQVGPIRLTFAGTQSAISTTLIPGLQEGEAVPATSGYAVELTGSFSSLEAYSFAVVQATLASGAAHLQIENRTGIDFRINRLEVLNLQGTRVALYDSEVFIAHGAQQTLQMTLEEGVEITPEFTVRLELSWDEQIVQSPERLTLNIRDAYVEASAVEIAPLSEDASFEVTSPTPVVISEDLTYVVFSPSNDPAVNQLTLTVTNHFDFPLEDGAGGGPRIRLYSGGEQINVGQEQFDAPIAPGSSASLTVNVSGKTLYQTVLLGVAVGFSTAQQRYHIESTDGVQISLSSTALEVQQAQADIPPIAWDQAVDWVDLGESLEYVQLAAGEGNTNKLYVTLTNHLPVTLTDASAQEGAPPRLILQISGQEDPLAELVFDRAIRPGETAHAEVSLAGKRLPARIGYVFDVGTPGGSDVLFDQADQVRFHVRTGPLQLESVRAMIPEQSGLSFQREGLTLGETFSFEGALLQQGSATLWVTNEWPVDIVLDELVVRNAAQVGNFPAGYEAFRLEHIRLPAHARTPISLHLAEQTPLASTVDLQVTLSTPGSSDFVEVTAQQAMHFELEGNLGIEEIYLRPQGEQLEMEQVLSLGGEQFSFAPGDFLEIKEGVLVLEHLVNNLEVQLEELTISLPDVRKAPYGPGDSLVIRFIRGAQDTPDQYIFAGITAKSRGETRRIPLRGLRIYLQGNTLPYRLSGRLETTSEIRTIHASDSLMGDLRVAGLQLGAGQIHAEAFAFNLTSDVNGNGWLDIDEPGEWTESAFDQIRDWASRVQEFALSTSELTLQIQTNLVADAVLYLAIQGIDVAGRTFFLGGKGAYAVRAGDGNARQFAYQGAVLSADQLIRVPLHGAQQPGDLVTRSVLLNNENSTLNAFLSRLPVSIRMVGRVVLSPSGGRIAWTDPMVTRASIGVRVPLSLGEATIQLNDTIAVDFGFLGDVLASDEEKKPSVQEASLTLHYRNGLPIEADVQVEALDQHYQQLAQFPVGEAIQVKSAPVDENGFARSRQAGEATLSLSSADLRALYQARYLRLNLVLQSVGEGHTPVSLRASDALLLRVSGRFALNIPVN